MVDGSNESLYHADEEMHPLVRTFSPSQTIFQNLDVSVIKSNQKDGGSQKVMIGDLGDGGLGDFSPIFSKIASALFFGSVHYKIYILNSGRAPAKKYWRGSV